VLSKIMDPVITELDPGIILWDDSVLILLKLFVPYINLLALEFGI
jgi:hypothetical protein